MRKKLKTYLVQTLIAQKRDNVCFPRRDQELQ